jgi:hypothetical protein
MANVLKFKCTEFTASGNEVFNVDASSEVNEFQVICVSGTIFIEGETGPNVNIFGKAVSPIALESGQGFNFNRIQYSKITITVTNGTICRFVANN